MALGFPAVRHRRLAILLAATIAAAPAASLAQDPKKKPPDAPAKLPKVPADRARGLDFLFGALKAAPDEASAKHVEARIWAIWLDRKSVV